MIQIREKLKVGAAEFFGQLRESVAYDASEATGSPVALEEIQTGYSYEKRMKNRMGSAGSVKVQITEWTADRCYEAEFISSGGTNRLKYVIEEDPEGGIWGDYTEDYVGSSKSLELNYKIVSVFMNRGAKKRARRLLHAIESYLLEKKER